MEFYDFPYFGNGIIIPTDELIFFRGVGIPPTRYKREYMMGTEWGYTTNCKFFHGGYLG
jgi:hypothetical protein